MHYETKTNVNSKHIELVETHIFSFVVGRAFVTDIEKLKLSSKIRALEAEKVLLFFSETTKDGIRPGANLLHAVEVLVSGVCALIYLKTLIQLLGFVHCSYSILNDYIKSNLVVSIS
ncbi:hypothetical protein ACS0TY_017692 [Phlomoides rotata]